MNWFETFSRHLEETVPAISLLIMVLVVVIDVIGRYVFNHPLLWAGELATMLFIWQTFLAAAGGLRRGLHIGVEFVVNTFPQRLQALSNFIIYLIMLVMLVIVAYMGLGYARQAHFKMMQIIGISYTWVDLAAPVGCLLMAIHLLGDIRDAFKGIATGRYLSSKIGFAGTGAVMPQEVSINRSGG